MPTVVNVGAVASGTGAITPAFPAAIASGDILVTVAECEGVTAPGAYTLPGGWAHVTGSPVLQGTNTRLWVIWRRYDGTGTAPSLGDSGDHNVGRMIAVRGCPATGNPWNVVASAVEATSDTSAAWPGVTTTQANCLILEIVCSSADVASTGQLGALTNGTYTSITERMDNWISSGNGGGIGMVTAVKATTGATGSSTGTLVTAGFKALMTLAFADAIVMAQSGAGTDTISVVKVGGGRAAPTFVAEYESAWDNTTTPKTVSVTTAAGDVVVVFGLCEDGTSTTLNTPTGNSLTYNLERSVVAGGFSLAYAWTATDAAGGTGWTLSASTAGTAKDWGFVAVVFRDSDGVGASAVANVTGPAGPTLDLATTDDASAIAEIIGDWSAQAVTGRTWRTINAITPAAGAGEVVAFEDATTYSGFGAYWSDTGAAGTKTTGMTVPSQKYSIIAVEVLGQGGEAGPAAAVDTGTGTDTTSVAAALTAADAGSGSHTLLASAAVPLVDSGTAADTVTVGQAATKTPIDAGSGSDAALIAATLPLPDAGTGTDTALVTAALILAQTGTGTDVPSVQQGNTPLLSDTGTGSDVALIAALIFTTDSAAATDAGATLTATFPESAAADDALATAAALLLTQPAAGTDTATVQQGSTPSLLDTGSSTATALVAAVLTATDAGTAADTATVTAGTTPIGLPDTGAGTAQLSVAASTAATDSGAASESSVLTAALTTVDTGTATDVLQVAQGSTPSLVDSGAATDTGLVAATVPVADTGAAADAVTVDQAAAKTLTDAGTGTEVLAAAATQTLTDTAAAADTLQVQQGSTPFPVDSGTGTDQLVTAAAVTTTDTGTGTDTAVVNVAKTPADTGAAADTLVVNVAKTLTDSGTATDVLRTTAAVTLGDLAAAAETTMLAALITIADTSTCTDRLILVSIGGTATIAAVTGPTAEIDINIGPTATIATIR